MTHQESFAVATPGRGTIDISGEISRIVRESGIETGLACVSIHHSSASLILCENADPQVRHDLEVWLARMVPDGDPCFRHRAEGPDDMPAHVRTVLTGSSLTLPITGGRLALGTWQGAYLYEHRTAPQRRLISVTVLGEGREDRGDTSDRTRECSIRNSLEISQRKP